MNDKEYIYDIDKYTIGVDTNGEDGIGLTVAKIENGIGLTVAKIENGEINFLGNCYGENARCLDLLIKENQELKEQVNKGLYNTCLPYTTGYNKAIKDKENQQKEFIKYLEDEISKLKKEYGNYVYDDYSEEKGKYDTYIEILQKYKSIIGDDK